MQIVIVAIVTILVVIGFIVYTLKNLLFVATPNQVLVLAGGKHMVGNKPVGYRAIRGGRAVRLPLIETVHWMDISNIPVDIEVRHAFSKGGIPLNVQGVAHVKLPGKEPRLSNAVERFLGRSRAEIAQVARETLEGNVRGVLAQLTPEQVNEDKMAFANQLLAEADHDFSRIGLVLDTLKIQNVTDDSNYLNSIGRIRGADIRRDAAVAEANRSRPTWRSPSRRRCVASKMRSPVGRRRSPARKERSAPRSPRSTRISIARRRAPCRSSASSTPMWCSRG